MKKLIIVVIIFVVITFFIMDNKKINTEKEVPVALNVASEKRAVFISYIELQEYIKGKSKEESQKNIIKMLDNLQNNNFNMVLLHVRPFSDAIYYSQIFPSSNYVVASEGVPLEYDILEYFIDAAHQRNIELHAWINPYRIRSNTDTSSIATSNPAYKYLNTEHVKIIEGVGIYYNPSSSVVRDLIVEGVKEIVSNYDVDGIHFDDYFYPDDTIDLENYQEYINNGGTLTLSDYRLNNTSMLIKDVYQSIKNIKKEVQFGISPEGNINNNYDSNYIDTKKLLSVEGYVDYIMPQIYFGFLNEVMPFIDTANMWNSLIKVNNIKIIPALGIYKSGTIDNFAKSGSSEWIDNNDIITKQVLISRRLNHYGGFSIFRYSYMFNDDYTKNNPNLQNEFKTLQEIIK